MLIYFETRRLFLTMFIGLFFCLSSFSQIVKADIVKKYVIKDTTLHNKEAYLILSKNNVFINFGIYNNKKDMEWYVWYTSGTYQLVGGKIVCQSYANYANKDQLIKDIKYTYKRRADHILIDTDYEFAYEKYNDQSFDIDGEKVTDQAKKLEYFEVN